MYVLMILRSMKGTPFSEHTQLGSYDNLASEEYVLVQENWKASGLSWKTIRQKLNNHENHKAQNLANHDKRKIAR